MKFKIISLFFTLFATNALSSSLNKSLELRVQQELEINLELQLKFLAKKNNEKFSALEMNTGAIPWSPTSWGFRCGFVRQSDYKLPQKYYVFQNPIDAEFWTPINGKSRNRTYWQVSVSK